MFQVYSKISNSLSGFRVLKGATVISAVIAGSVFAQPDKPPAPYLACQAEPTGAGNSDTLASGIDNEGYISLFDGSTQKGWWHNCQTGHSRGGRGGMWKVVPELKAIYSTQDGDAGSILMTNKKFLNYELVWDYWPDFKNDGGIFNRVGKEGNCFQTVLDYIGGAALGGTWGEASFTSRDFRPFSFGGDETSIAIPGNNQGEPSNWTLMTQKMKAAGQNFPCPTTGCTQTEWRSLWSMDDWNQLRLRFYGGIPGDSRVRMKFWFRKVGAVDWIPVSADTTLMQSIPAGYIGLQVHGGGRFSGAKGTWYRNIKWTPLTDKGERIYTGGTRTLEGKVRSDIKVGDNTLVGSLDLDHEITIKDIRGVTVQTIKGKAGNFNYTFAPRANGLLTMQIKTAKGTEFRSLIRDVQ